MELLAPLPNIDFAIPVIDSGIDAVYLGLRNFNARMRARNFSFDELAAVIEYAHKRNVRIYITFNTLIKEIEIRKAAEYLDLLSGMDIDAIIIQDLGILNLLKFFFPEIKRIHSSTQMFLFDENSIRFAAENNIKRIILPRELSYNELTALDKSAGYHGIELEIFAHGSLCYSLSGNCSFSYFHNGGQSGNRGLCCQPCRKIFTLNQLEDKMHASNKKAPFFSMSDLALISNLPGLYKLKSIKSLKIEGRLKHINYILTIIREYKNVLTAIESENNDLQNIILKAVDSIKNAGGRKLTSGYYNFPHINDEIFSGEQTELYQKAGSINAVKDNSVVFTAANEFKKNDLFKLEKSGSFSRISIKINEITDMSGKNLESVSTGMQIIFTANKKIDSNDCIYFFNTGDICGHKKLKTKKTDISHNEKKLNSIFSYFEKFPEKKIVSTAGRSEYLFLFESDFVSSVEKKINEKFKSKKIIIEISGDITDNSFITKIKKIAASIIISIPLYIDTHYNSVFRHRIFELRKSGINNFFVSHISQKYLFDEIKNLKTVIYTGPSVYAMNSFSSEFIEKSGYSGFTYSLEDDTENIKKIRSKLKSFLFIESYPPLFNARMLHSELLQDKIFLRDENDTIFRIKKNSGIFKTIAKKAETINNSEVYLLNANFIKIAPDR